MRSLASDRFLDLRALIPMLGRGRKGETKTYRYVREIAMAQNGRFKDARFSQANLRSFPPMKKGPGGRYGVWLSEFERWREESR